MAEKAKSFKIDDKVYGKVKGYPAWPARITSINGKRYGVVFYGTNETASLKQDDVFYYLSHKHKFPMQKRRFYPEAVVDIELDIANCGGSDGNDNAPDENTQVAVAAPKGGKRKRGSTASKKSLDSAALPSNKRMKREDQNHNLNDITSENNVINDGNDQDVEVAKATQSTLDKFIIHNTPTPTPSEETLQETVVINMEDVSEKSDEEIVKEVKEDNIATCAEEEEDEEDVELEEQKKEDTIDIVKNELPETAANDIPETIKTNATTKEEMTAQKEQEPADDVEETAEEVEEPADEVQVKKDEVPKENPYYTRKLTVKDVNLLPDFYLSAIMLYAERVQENSHYYKINKPDAVSLDDESDDRLKVLPVKIDVDKYCGLIYATKPLTSYRCEYDRALDDAKLVEELLELKAEIDVGNLDLHDERFIKHLDCDGAYVRHTTNSSIVAYKKAKLQWLETEMEAFKALLAVKKCLGFDAARTDDAIAHLETLLNAKLEVISLKKRAFMVDTIHRLGRYIGNAKDWDFSEEDLKSFEVNAGKIRELAEQIMEKIRDLFGYGEKAEFLEKFEAECEVFNTATKGMSEAVVFSLCAEPLSRKAQLELIFDEQANNQNPSDAAESDDTTDVWYTPD